MIDITAFAFVGGKGHTRFVKQFITEKGEGRGGDNGNS